MKRSPFFGLFVVAILQLIPLLSNAANAWNESTARRHVAEAINGPLPTLSDLTISKGTLSPTFASGTTFYEVYVNHATTSITITPTTIAAGATIKVNGSSVVSGTASSNIPLTPGFNTITTIVTASGGATTDTYTIILFREYSTVATLSSLVTDNGTLSPAFAAGTTNYTDSVTNDIKSVKVTPTTTDANATVTVNGTPVSSGTASAAIALAIGPNIITTVV